LIDDGETDVLSYLDFPEPYRSKLHSTNPLERSSAAPAPSEMGMRPSRVRMPPMTTRSS
jgi:hypothetical protein